MDGSIEPVRRMTAADLGECLRVGEPVFRKYWPHMDATAMLAACLANLDNETVFMMRCGHAFGVAVVETTLFEPRPWVKEQWVFGLRSPWEVLAIYRAMMLWGVQVGAFRFTFGSLTDHDVEPFAKHLGEHSVHKSFTFELKV